MSEGNAFRSVKRIIAAGMVMAMLFWLSGCGNTGVTTTEQAEETVQVEEVTYEGEHALVLSGDSATLDGTAVGESETDAVFISHDIVYYENRETYDSGNTYGEGGESDMHTAEDAAANAVVNITEAGIYRVSGSLTGQLKVDLGEDAFDNPEAVVTLVLDGADINCTVAPGVIFENVYECDGEWSTETATSDVDTTAAGANVIVADGSVNTVTGSHVAKIFKDNADEKKLVKQDGAFYSYMSMNISSDGYGGGTLNIIADNEGVDSELHLTINSGNINIQSADDAINTNEDGVSVTTINGGNIHILGGLGAEGDGIDSNGFLVINGGTVVASANPASDSGLDSDMGSYINGGTVIALGSTMDWPESESNQVTLNLQFAEYQSAEALIEIKNADGNVIFSYDLDEDEVVAGNNRKFMGAVISDPDLTVGETYTVWIDGVQQCYSGTDVGMGGFGGMQPPEGMEMPEDFDPSQMGERPEMPDGEEPPEMPEGMELPDDFDPSQMQGGQPGGNGQQGGQPGAGGQGTGGPQPGTDGEEPPEKPDGEQPQGGGPAQQNGATDGQTPPAKPDGEEGEAPEGFDPSQMQGGQPGAGGQGGNGQPTEGNEQGAGNGASSTTDFYMTDKVNCFSGVKAAE